MYSEFKVEMPTGSIVFVVVKKRRAKAMSLGHVMTDNGLQKILVPLKSH